MTQCFGTNDNNDLFIGMDGRLVIYSDLEATLQACEHAMKAQLGEMVLAVDQGIPTLQTVWSGVKNLPQFEAAARRAILAVSGVIAITAFTMQQMADQLFYTANITTVYGQGTATTGDITSG